MNNLHLIVKEQFPQFVVAKYPAFVAFVQAYYEWLELKYADKIENIVDIDTTPEEFVKYFASQLDVFGVSQNAIPFDIKYLKNIKEIYASKGSEQGLIELLRIFKSVNATVDYPNENILRPSDGKWVQESFITVSIVSGAIPESADTFYIDYQDKREVVVSKLEPISETQVRIYYRRAGTLPIQEGRIVILKSNGDTVGFGLIVKSVASLIVVDGGINWQLGQVIVFPGTERDTIVRVSKVTTLGTIQRVEIVEYGYPHEIGDSITAIPSINNPGIGEATLEFVGVDSVKLLGKWKDESGQISNDSIRLQDNLFWQQFSYVVNSDQTQDIIEPIAQIGHVAGTKPFYNLRLQTALGIDIEGFTTFPFIDLQLGPDLVSFIDPGIQSFELTAFKETIVSLAGEPSWSLDKYLQPSTVTLTQTENTNFNVGLYAVVGYFAEDYNAAEITLNIGV